mgnify:CR=1 FL=1
MNARQSISGQSSVESGQVLAEIKRIVGEQMGREVGSLSAGDSLARDINCDSLDIVEIVMLIEEEFDISVSDEMAQQVDTIGDVAAGVSELLAQRTD